jgi:acyl carrier protein
VSDRERLDAAFRNALDLSETSDLKDLAYGTQAEWDSIGHLQLVAAIEGAFGIAIAPEDVVNMVDYGSVCGVLRERHGLDC